LNLSLSLINPLKPKFAQIIYKKPVRTSQEANYASATKYDRLMLFRELISVYCGHNAECLCVHVLTTGHLRVKYNAIETCRDYTFLTSALCGAEWSAKLPSHFTLAKGFRYASVVAVHRRYRRCGRKTRFLPLPRVELRFLGRLTSNLVAIPTELSRL
jgi:hypothetical protein